MPTKHPKYYFQDGNMIIQVGPIFRFQIIGTVRGLELTKPHQVEDVLFKIHRYQVREGALGEDLPRPLSDQNEGLDPVNPIKISQLSAKAFEALLDVLYHR